MGDKRADRTIVMRHPITVMMECKSHDQERQTNKEKRKALFIHRPVGMESLRLQIKVGISAKVYFR
jgi:hypothetical protein